jgi:Gpi18-like mannosyltransferase
MVHARLFYIATACQSGRYFYFQEKPTDAYVVSFQCLPSVQINYCQFFTFVCNNLHFTAMEIIEGCKKNEIDNRLR